MKSGYKCSAKRIAAIGVMLCMLVLTCLTVTSVLNTKAEESIGQGHVNYDDQVKDSDKFLAYCSKSFKSSR